MAPSQKVNLKDKVEDGEIDLSMCDLQDVPVKEIATIKNVFSLDMSNNHLTHLPKNFGTLTHLTKLDISKNMLKDLPDNFGDLIKLKHLDLYKNELQHLPLSFSKLKALKWLDLKDNPLVPAIKEKAGPCLDSKQCQTCAKNIVQFYIEFQHKVENEREVRDKQRQKDKQANELATQKQKLQEKKNKKKDKPKSKEYDEVVTDDMSTVNEFIREEGNIKEKHKKQPYSYGKLVIKLLLAILIILFVTLFSLTSIQAQHTQHFERHIILQWNHIISNLPPSIMQFGRDFGEYFKALHTMTGNGILFLANQIQEIQKEDNSIFKKIENFYNSLKGTVNFN